MSILYLDLGMGAAGDMLSAALFELLPNKETFLEKLNSLGIEDVAFEAVPVQKCGILGTKMKVLIGGKEEGHEEEESFDHHGHAHSHEEHSHGGHEHEHGHHDHHHGGHEHGHDHAHTGMKQIEETVASLSVSEKVKSDILNVYRIIAEAESSVHGESITQIHFHEVGEKDAIADITAVCMLMDELKPEKVIASPIHVGSGTVKCAHGILPVPAPATALILLGIPIYSTQIKGELCTPTGAALVKYFADEFGPMPQMSGSAIGYGMGTKDFPRLNCVRALLGETHNAADVVAQLSCNIDDMTGEDIGFAAAKLLEEGANDVYTIPVMMKKSRPASMLCVICKEEESERFARLIFKYTTTIGIRKTIHQRYVLDRTIVENETPYGAIRSKVSSGYGVKKIKPEYDDIIRAAEEFGCSPETIRRNLNGN